MPIEERELSNSDELETEVIDEANNIGKSNI